MEVVLDVMSIPVQFGHHPQKEMELIKQEPVITRPSVYRVAFQTLLLCAFRAEDQ